MESWIPSLETIAEALSRVINILMVHPRGWTDAELLWIVWTEQTGQCFEGLRMGSGRRFLSAMEQYGIITIRRTCRRETLIRLKPAIVQLLEPSALTIRRRRLQR